MASMSSLTLLYLPLLLLLPQLSHSAPIPQPKNLTQHEPRPSSTYIVHANHLAKPSPFATLEHWYTSMVATHPPRAAVDSSCILYTYDTVMHGFAVQLTGDEARRMSGAVGVTGVYEDRRHHLQTTRSPGFLGLDPGFGAWQDTDFGDGVIIGIVDTGIWPERSFNDSGLGPVRSSSRGKCVGAGNFNASLCNNKLVGAKVFDKRNPSPSPRDLFGHGTFMVSMAAGSEVRDAGFLMFAQGMARGVAPKVGVAMYKACNENEKALYCNSVDVVAAVDAAVKDGVDIISLSLGLGMFPFYNDALAIAAFGAERKGIFVVVAGGNDGPRASTIKNVAPWMITVGSATVNRLFPANLNLGDGTVLTGQSLYDMKVKGTAMIPLVYSCMPTPDKIVVCIIGKAEGDLDILANAGGAGLLVGVHNFSWFREGVEAVAVIINGKMLPCLVLSYTDGEKLRAYMDSIPSPVASFSFACETVIGENRAPMVWPNSSRGPNPVVPVLLKPDVIAPGHNILGAWTYEASLANARNDTYVVASGTSIACPHVASVAALIKKKHSTWTPAMMRSALMTTAGTLNNTDREILDSAVVDRVRRGATPATPFAAGAGHVRPQLAMDPGLVYDASSRDFVDFLCALNYTAEQLRRFAPDLATCTRELPAGPAGLNYPSFIVVFDGPTDVRTLTPTVTKVSEEAETYKVTVKEQYEKSSYTVEFRSEAGGNVKAAGWEFGHIIWENEKHRVRSPVAFTWKTNN